MEKGDIILIPFPFTDLKGSKIRQALVLVSTESDITVSFISTQMKWVGEYDIVLNPTRQNGLKKDSLLRLSKLATIDKELAFGKLGTIGEQDLTPVNQNLIKLFQLDGKFLTPH